MSESLKNVLCDKLLHVLKLLYNIDGVCLSLLLVWSDCSDCSECSDCLSIENIRLLNSYSFIFLKLKLCCGFVLLLNSSIYWAK